MRPAQGGHAQAFQGRPRGCIPARPARVAAGLAGAPRQADGRSSPEERNPLLRRWPGVQSDRLRGLRPCGMAGTLVRCLGGAWDRFLAVATVRIVRPASRRCAMGRATRRSAPTHGPLNRRARMAAGGGGQPTCAIRGPRPWLRRRSDQTAASARGRRLAFAARPSPLGLACPALGPGGRASAGAAAPSRASPVRVSAWAS